MEKNLSVTYFILKGISSIPELQTVIFLMVLAIYIITVGGNMTILLLTCLNHQLHTPMYFFLCNLSFLDLCFSTTTLHQVIVMFISGSNMISFQVCMSQLYFFMSFVGIEMLILTAMSYDRYVAICNPLHYQIVMRGNICIPLAIVCWVLGFLETIPYICLFLDFSCFRHNVINHFYCDLSALMDISCSDTTILKKVILYESIFSGFTPFLLTFVSYTYIINTLLEIGSKLGGHKAFYTCASHLTVVGLFYMTLFSLYLKPSSSLESEKVISLLYTAMVPMINPLIYSLKNKDVKSALRHMLCRTMSQITNNPR
ncbi:olfactory receptor 8A1-like [Rhinophrynus dorsalis]